MRVTDTLNRPMTSLRISVTERCNLRCNYCMPEDDYTWLPRESILSYEEIVRLVDVFMSLGVDRLRITGGEPLLRENLPSLIEQLAARSNLRDLALTTNAVKLASQASVLRAAGLHRVTISLDTLQPKRFFDLTKFDVHKSVLTGIEAAVNAGFQNIKLDTVVIRGVNDDELVALLEYAKRLGVEIRFIEYMDVGGATQWSSASVVSRKEMLKSIGDHFGSLTPVHAQTAAPADRFKLPDGTIFGIISSTTQPFCRSCDRSRLTADGLWYLCLYAQEGVDLRQYLRNDTPPDEIASIIQNKWSVRNDRGAEARVATPGRTTFIPLGRLREEPHLEMHTRGG